MNKNALHSKLISQLGDSFAAIGREIRLQHGAVYTCLTPALDKVLLLAGSQDDINVKTIATLLTITPGAATQHVAALEELQLVNRVTSAQDRREVIVSLLPKGRALYKKVRLNRLQLLENIFSGLDDTELETLVMLISKATTKHPA